MSRHADDPPAFASPPCFAHELDLHADGHHAVDADRAADVTRWRKAERARLVDRRLAVPADERRRAAGIVAGHLDRLLERSTERQRDPRPDPDTDTDTDTVVSLYWPFRGELNLRDWMHELAARGTRVALPQVTARATPLTFREWTPACRLEPGIWNIPVPIDGAALTPTVLVAPLIGFDPERYRLGYGGGFFDRTLAAMHARGARPTVIGVGHSSAAIRTIYPQPHDVPMTVVVTEGGVLERAPESM